MHSNGNDRALGVLTSPQRNNYYYGKLMDVPHFEMEQRYVNRKRWLLNRLGLGAGVLCGLQLSIKDKKVCISPGVAIDGYGREIVVPHDVCVDPWTLTDECGSVKSKTISNNEAHKVLLCLAYTECQTDPMPVLVSDCNTKAECLNGTNVESFCVLVKELKEEPAQLPPAIDPKLCKILGTDATQEQKRQVLCTTNPAAACGQPVDEVCVWLGTVGLNADGTIAEDQLDQCSRRTVLVSNQHLLDMLLCVGGAQVTTTGPEPNELTKINNISWSHDGLVALQDFPSTLKVTFSENVTTSASDGRAWFVVTLEFPGGGGGGIGAAAVRLNVGTGIAAFSTSAILNGDVQLKNKEATFTVDPNFLTAAQAVPQPTTTNTKTLKFLCRVTVKCDFLLDGNQAAVDGNHLGGITPTGDGTAGGIFESWFFVTLTSDVT